MVDVNKVYEKYQKAIEFLDKLMDTTVDLLNSLKLEDPEKPVNVLYFEKYKKIIQKLEKEIKRVNIKKDIL